MMFVLLFCRAKYFYKNSMKYLFLITALLISAISFSQDHISIKGNILDLEANNTPLEMAHVSIKETGDKTITDENGNFTFKALTTGTYTLSLSFTGYETKTVEVQVINNEIAKINESLSANTLSITDLMLTFANADEQETPTSSTTVSN